MATFQYFLKNGNTVPKCLAVSYTNILLNVLFPVDIPFTALHPCMFSEFYISYLIISVSSVLLNITIYSKAICVGFHSEEKPYLLLSPRAARFLHELLISATNTCSSFLEQVSLLCSFLMLQSLQSLSGCCEVPVLRT